MVNGRDSVRRAKIKRDTCQTPKRLK